MSQFPSSAYSNGNMMSSY
uniref:Uncharacterized protein n=1 Tax=Rhizophora mucronata TaxID=61149 RepID=A0A2P2L681_RHIMU